MNRPSGGRKLISKSIHRVGARCFTFQMSFVVEEFSVVDQAYGGGACGSWVPLWKSTVSGCHGPQFFLRTIEDDLTFPPVSPYEFFEGIDAHVDRIVVRHIDVPLL